MKPSQKKIKFALKSKANMKKITIGILLVVLSAGAGIYFYMYKGHRDIAKEDSAFILKVSELTQQYSAAVGATNKKYLDKTIEVAGTITAIDTSNHSVVIDEKLSAVFKDSVLPNFSVRKAIKIKGRFIGYDDLLEEFKMDQVSLSD